MTSSTQTAPAFLDTLDKHDSMLSDETLVHLHQLAKQAASQRGGVIVEIGAHRGASTVALATGVRTAHKGKVHSIDPHLKLQDAYDGVYSEVDHLAYEQNLRIHGMDKLVVHHCRPSADVVENWDSPIDLLFIDSDHSYEGVKFDLRSWLPFVANDGVVAIEDFRPGSDVADAVRDHLPFARFITQSHTGRTLILKRAIEPRTMYLCGGMQSSGSTLVSWCFLQRPDLDGIDDMWNRLIHQDFSKVQTDSVWVKMTIGSFRLSELAELYRAQGWSVRPVLIKRNISDVLTSLQRKTYGVDGATGDDPPLFLRVRRYLEDVQHSQRLGWPTIVYEDLLKDPRAVIFEACSRLGLPWTEDMISWPKPAKSVAVRHGGSMTFQETKAEHDNLLGAVQTYVAKLERFPAIEATVAPQSLPDQMAQVGLDLMLDHAHDDTMPTLSPIAFRGTERNRRDRRERKLRQSSSDLRRIQDHPVFGSLLKLWKLLINKSFPA